MDAATPDTPQQDSPSPDSTSPDSTNPDSTSPLGQGSPGLLEQAPGWGRTILEVLHTPWPYAAAHTSTGPDDCDVTPSRLHPAFHSSLDWHSSVHMQWSAITLIQLGVLEPELVSALVAELDDRLTLAHGQVEADYVSAHRGWERPYGWGWAAMLTAAATALAADADHPYSALAHTWSRALHPIADAVADHLLAWLEVLTVPVRHGVHSNTAFGLTLARDGYEALGRADVVAAIDAAAQRLYLGDVDYPSHFEPSGADFLSGALSQADLMRRVLPAAEFGGWLNTFLPVLAEPGDALLRVPEVLDPSDGQAVHLYGLALSRAAQLRAIAPHLEPARGLILLSGADELVTWATPAITHGDFMSTHWLVSFALLAELMA